MSPEVILKRLASCTAKNRFYRANRDLGRVFKTEFLLSYLSEPQLRSRIRRGLLKVEQLHALARDVYYGRRGRSNARELHEQMNSCSCLTLILACVIYWQAKEISRVVRWCHPEDEKIDVALLEHVSIKIMISELLDLQEIEVKRLRSELEVLEATDGTPRQLLALYRQLDRA